MSEIIKTQVMNIMRKYVSEIFEVKYILLERGISPIEFHKPGDWHGIIEKSAVSVGKNKLY